MASNLRIGTSGWSYPNGDGRWNGIFYPARGQRGFRAGEELRYYATHFNTVEVNSTFYRLPDRALTSRWVEQTPGDFEFSVKLFQSFTHPMKLGHGAQKPTRAEGGTPLPKPTRAELDAFRSGIEPIAAAGKMGMLLVQFPAGFHATPESRDYLSRMLGALRDYPVAVELRHRTWSDGEADTLALLGETGAAWVQIDEPKFRFSIRQDRSAQQAGYYYMRLHGRNAANWWTHDHADDRYNYLYSPTELAPIASAVQEARAQVRKAYLYLNNHFSAKAVVNATELKHQLGEPVEGEFQEEMLARYPQLQPIVAARSRRPSDTSD